MVIKNSSDSKSCQASWDAFHERLKQARQNIEHDWSTTDERKKEILRDRAHQMAAPLASTQHEERQRSDVVVFTLAQEEYGIESRHVDQVASMRECVPIPGASSLILGIMNLRGQLIPIINLKSIFDLSGTVASMESKAIILHVGEITFGIQADSVAGVVSIAANQLHPPPPTLTGIRAEYCAGITSNALIVLNTERLLTDEKLIPRSANPSI